MELQGNIRVQCRIRPILGADKLQGDDTGVIVPVDGQSLQAPLARGDDRIFEFDRVHPPSCSNADVFNELASLITSFLDGCVWSLPWGGVGICSDGNGFEGLVAHLMAAFCS
jgi:kinesin family protein C1